MGNTINDYKTAVKSIREGDKELLGELILQFNPLLKKYSYLSDDEDTYSELVLTFVETILKANFEKFNDKEFNYQFLAYISRAIKNKYILLSKKHQIAVREVVPLENAYNVANIDNEYGDVHFFEIISELSQQQAEILTLIYYWGYSASEVARKKKMSRQAVNQCKQRALKILRNNSVGGNM